MWGGQQPGLAQSTRFRRGAGALLSSTQTAGASGKTGRVRQVATEPADRMGVHGRRGESRACRVTTPLWQARQATPAAARLLPVVLSSRAVERAFYPRAGPARVRLGGYLFLLPCRTIVRCHRGSL